MGLLTAVHILRACLYPLMTTDGINCVFFVGRMLLSGGG